MSQGNYGGWNPEQQPGGYGQPPAGGYGQPPAGPPGGPPGPGGWGAPPPAGPNMGGAGGGGGGFGRLLPKAAIGGAIGGVLSVIPILSLLNCCFCLLNIAGVGIGMKMHFSANPQDKMNMGEAAGFGAIAGAIAGLIAGVVGFVLNLALAGLMASLLKSMPRDAQQIFAQLIGGGVAGIFTRPPMFAVFGAIGGILLLMVAFKDNKIG